jgi:hypothetical protein
MEDSTIRSKITALLRKSSHAVRLYSSVDGVLLSSSSKVDTRIIDNLAQSQSKEWKYANETLCSALSKLLKFQKTGEMTSELLAIAELFKEEWRDMERDVHRDHRVLERVAIHGDYMQAALVSMELVRFKARRDAYAAVHEEIVALIRSCRIIPQESGRSRRQQVPLDSLKSEPLEVNCDEPLIQSSKITESDSAQNVSGSGRLLSFRR